MQIDLTDGEWQRVIDCMTYAPMRECYDVVMKITAQRAKQTIREVPAAQAHRRGDDNGGNRKGMDGAGDEPARDPHIVSRMGERSQ